MHDYLTKEKTMLEPQRGDFVAFVQKLQQNRLKALNPDMFNDSSTLAPGRIIDLNTKKATARIFSRGQKGLSSPGRVEPPAPVQPGRRSTITTAGSTAARRDSTFRAAVGQAAPSAPPRRTTAQPDLSAGAPDSTGSSTKKKRNQGNFIGFFFTIMMMAAIFIGVNTRNQYIPLTIIAAAFAVMVIVSSRNKRKKYK